MFDDIGLTCYFSPMHSKHQTNLFSLLALSGLGLLLP